MAVLVGNLKQQVGVTIVVAEYTIDLLSKALGEFC
jgi:hypothetical protein|tara:strand:+ start:96 stop:200 length:105 start_codon:yes stop_codon:yes gene_type:complete